MTDTDIEGRARALAGPTARLVELLRSLAAAGDRVATDVDDHATVLWLHDRPLTATLHPDAAAGEVLLTLDPVPPRTGDDVRHRRWYDALSELARQLDQHDDELELVVASGLLSWAPPEGRPVRTHLLTARVRPEVDPRTGRLAVVVDERTPPRLEDREVLGRQGRTAPADDLRARVRTELPAPAGDAGQRLLATWRRTALPAAVDALDELAPATSCPAVGELRRAPALVLRRRSSSGLVGHYDRILAALSGPDAAAPVGLAQLVTPVEPDVRRAWAALDGGAPLLGDDPLFPLPTNEEQRAVYDRLRDDDAVVVQGPPGTGKSHSIANLLAALLAQGQRVLVTSQKAQALRVLRDKLPPEIAELCVSTAGSAAGDELDRSVAALAERFATSGGPALDRRVAELAERRRHEQERVAAVVDRLAATRQAEARHHPDVAPGFGGTLAEIAGAVREGRDAHGWVPVPLPEGAPGPAPLSGSELGELRRLLAGATPDRRARAGQALPDADALPPVTDVRAWFEAEARAVASARAAATPLSEQLAGLPRAVTDELAGLVGRARAGLDRLGIDPSTPDDDRGGDWRRRALADGLARRERPVWQHLHASAGRATDVARLLDATTGHDIALPRLGPTGQASARRQLAAGRELLGHLAAGGRLRRILPPAVQRAAEPLLRGATVDGGPPDTPAALELALTHLEADVEATALAGQWSLAGVHLDPDAPLRRRVAQLVEAAEALEVVAAVLAARNTVTARLRRAGVRVAATDLAGIVELDEAFRALARQREADAAEAAFGARLADLERHLRTGTAPPELTAAVQALADRAPDAYEAARRALVAALGEQADQRRCDRLWERLHESAPALAAELERGADDPVWDGRAATFAEAWAWAQAATFLERRRRPGLDDALDAELDDAVARLEAVTGELAAAEAWRHTLGRMTAEQAQALQVYRQAMTERGAGTGRHAARYERAARDAMAVARGAVPAWVLPLPDVLDTVPPDRGSFDVVIVDEASQAGLESLFLLWLAPRVVVVGDDRQCTPSQVAHGALEPIFDAVDQALPDVPAWLRIGFSPRSSLFSLLSARVGAVVRLREHFRSMPEIITWSSRQFYADAPLLPLRHFGADRLPPLRARHVDGAATEGTATRLRNRAEAEALVEQVVVCLDDPAYEGRTMGVVVLQGTGQVALLRELLRERVPATTWERRRLRVGTPPDFQGDERDVVFLSMVVAARPRAVTTLEWQRRLNVAASRARDQLWLFHSVGLDDLSPADLRRSLLAYVRHPPVAAVGPLVDEVADDRPHPAFASRLEQLVHDRIRRRGYHVVPGVEVGGRRVDLVVTGADGRLAVACDDGRTVATRDERHARLHHELRLRRAGWWFWRVRASEVALDPDAALASLWPLLERRGIAPHAVVDLVVPTPSSSDAPTWAPSSLSGVEGVDGLDDDPLGAAGLDLVGTVVLDPAVSTQEAAGPAQGR